MTVQLIDPRAHRLRHIFPDAAGTVTILGRTYAAASLTSSPLPLATDFVEAGYTYRLDDSGEASITFPNTTDPDGVPWKSRFSTDGALEFIEIYRDDRIEFVMCVERIDMDRGQVVVSGHDAAFLLRRAYERDRHWTAAPQEVIEAYTRVPVPIVADDFDGAALAAPWTKPTEANLSTVTLADSVARITANSGQGNGTIYRTDAGLTGDTWRAVLSVERVAQAVSNNVALSLIVADSYPATTYSAQIFWQYAEAFFSVDDSGINRGRELVMPAPLIQTGAFTLEIVRRGRWLAGYVNGRLIGFEQVEQAWSADTLAVESATFTGSGTFDVYLRSAALIEHRSLLARGADKGSYVLPGDYPSGGLRGRYWNDADMVAMDAGMRARRIFSPGREPAVERLDAIIDTSGGLTLPPDGIPADNFSARWFGAVYLRGDAGDYTFELTGLDDGARLWVGKTAWGAQIINRWTDGPGTYTGTWDASDHGSVAGWYPIVLEYREEGGGQTIRLQFTPPNTTYTDPGGTSIAASTKRIVPTTSLSPLGCYDNRVQGQSHFDVVFGAAAATGYQMTLEPMSLESGEFPGRLVPRTRVGVDTNLTLRVPVDDDGEPLFDPGVTLDSTDQVAVVIGSAAGLAESRGAQVSAEVADLTAASASLFTLETFVDLGDVAFPSLLEATLQAHLALRGSPWQEVRGTPRGQEKLAETFPLSAALVPMLWRVGYGVKLDIPEIGVSDATPRQLVQVGRTCTPLGRTGTSVAWRQRPRSAEENLRRLIRAATVRGRAYQGQIVTLNTEMVNSAGASFGAGAFTGYGMLALPPGERVVRAYVRVVLNTGAQALAAEVNNAVVTSALGGPWTAVPLDIDITRYATQVSPTDARLQVRLQNTGAAGSIVVWQLFVDVLR